MELTAGITSRDSAGVHPRIAYLAGSTRVSSQFVQFFEFLGEARVTLGSVLVDSQGHEEREEQLVPFEKTHADCPIQDLSESLLQLEHSCLLYLLLLLLGQISPVPSLELLCCIRSHH